MVDFMQWFFTTLLENFSSIGLTGVLAFLIYYIIGTHSKEGQNQTAFQHRLLDLNAQTISTNDRIVTSNEKMIALLDSHDKLAQERSDAQYIRDEKHLRTLEKIANYIPVLDSTQVTIGKIETGVVAAQSNIAGLQADIPALINLKHDEQLTKITDIQKTIEKSFQLIENALKKLQARLDESVDVQGSNVEVQGSRHSSLMTEMSAIAEVLKTVNLVVENVHTLVQTLQVIAPVVAVMPDVEDTDVPALKNAELAAEEKSHDAIES